MDLFHHHKDKDANEKRKSITGKPASGAKNSPKLVPHKPAKLDIEIESPPLVCYGPSSASTGALLSGQLIIEVIDEEVKLNKLEMKLVAKVVTRKPVVKDCTDCGTKSTDLNYWNFFSEPKTYKKGIHKLPFSYLLPGRLPATSENKLGSILYQLNAWSQSDFFEDLKVSRGLNLMRALPPSQDHTSIRVFPPTNLTANLVMPQHIYPIGEFLIQLRLTGTVEKEPEYFRHWVVKKMNWRIDEHAKMVSPPCSKHVDKVGHGKGVLNQDIRTIGGAEFREGWKNDFDEPGGSLEMEIKAGIRPGSHPNCDVDSASGYTITHELVIEIVITEELCAFKLHKYYTPTGAARVLRMKFNLILTERSGMGISWDEEQPPMYEDVPASPPGYAHMEDYTGEPIPYEALDRLPQHSERS